MVTYSAGFRPGLFGICRLIEQLEKIVGLKVDLVERGTLYPAIAKEVELQKYQYMRESLRDPQRLQHMLEAIDKLLSSNSNHAFTHLKATDLEYFGVVKQGRCHQNNRRRFTGIENSDC